MKVNIIVKVNMVTSMLVTDVGDKICCDMLGHVVKMLVTDLIH